MTSVDIHRYGRSHLLALYASKPPLRQLSVVYVRLDYGPLVAFTRDVACDVDVAGGLRTCPEVYIGCYQGCHSGRPHHPTPVLRPLEMVVGNWQTRSVVTSSSRSHPPLQNVHVDSHTKLRGWPTSLISGCFNTRSLIKKSMISLTFAAPSRSTRRFSRRLGTTATQSASVDYA